LQEEEVTAEIIPLLASERASNAKQTQHGITNQAAFALKGEGRSPKSKKTGRRITSVTVIRLTLPALLEETNLIRGTHNSENE